MLQGNGVRLWCAWLVLFAACATASGQRLDQRLLADAEDGRLDEFTFSSACLIAGGVRDECELFGWEAHYQDIQHQALAGLDNPSPRERLAALQAALHRCLLTGIYDRRASDVRLALSSGDFNCLSSAALLYSLARASDLEIEIRLERGHVNLRYFEPGQPAIIIEAESPNAVRPDASSAAARCLTPVELLGKFYYNRGVELLTRHEFAEGLELIAYSLRLDPRDSDARANFVAGINNWAAVNCAKGNYPRAATLIALGLQIAPDFAPLVANQELVRAKLLRP